MKFPAYVLRLATLLIAFAVALGVSATTAQAAFKKHSITGNARYQIGNGLPIPIGFSPAPNGKVKNIPGAIVGISSTGPHPKAIHGYPNQFSHPGTPMNIGVFLANPKVFQVKTAIPLVGPNIPISGIWQAGGSGLGRTGAPIVTYCGGQVVTPHGNPACASPAAAPGTVKGLLRYTKTTNQFGGPSQGSVGGLADVAVRAAGTPPGVVTAIFAFANPAGTGAQGAPFGWFNSTPGATPNPGILVAVAAANGSLITPLATVPSPGLPNPATSYGGPWTTGMLTVSVTNQAGPIPEVFVFSGFDLRNSSGVGPISLVAGSVSARGLTGPNGNRGWNNLTIGPLVWDPVGMPALPVGGLAAAFGLLALAGGYAAQRRSRR